MQNTMSFTHSFDEAIDFLEKVRMEFADNREKYNEFLTILNDYARSVTDLRGTIARMEELLKGRKHLITTFRTFLPKEHQCTLDGNDDDRAGEAKIEHIEIDVAAAVQNTMSSTYSISFNEAIDFVEKVEMEFADNREKYIEFLTILNDARSVTDLRGIIARMEELLKGCKHLIMAFRTFLPKEHQITLDDNNDDKVDEPENRTA